MEKDDRIYIRHILDAISAIEEFLKDKNYDRFLTNKLVQDGVIRELEIIGEASKKLSEKFKNLISEIPWKDISGMRDKLIHDYFNVDLEAVWKTANHDIPQLKSALLKK